MRTASERKPHVPRRKGEFSDENLQLKITPRELGGGSEETEPE